MALPMPIFENIYLLFTIVGVFRQALHDEHKQDESKQVGDR
jgi:hypothetical protein